MTNLKRKFLVVFLALLCTLCLVFGLTACEELGITDPTTDQGTENDGSGTTDDGSGTSSDDGSGTTGDEGGSSSGGDTTDPAPSESVDYDLADLVEMLPYDGLTVTIKDVSIVLPYSIDTGDGETSITGTQTVTFEAGEFYVLLAEAGESYTILAYADGEVSYNVSVGGITYAEMTYGATLYGDGETLYVLYGETSGTETSSQVIKVSYEYIINSITEAITSDEELMSYVTAISEQIEGLLSGETEIDSSILSLVEVIGGYSEELGTLITALSDTMFTTEMTLEGVTMTLDLTAIQTLVKNAYELSCSQFVDAYLGEGTYTTIVTYITALGSQNLFDVITSLTTSTGLDTDTVYALVDMIVEYITGESFDLAALLNGDGTIESQYEILTALQAMTVDEFLTEYAGIDTTAIATVLTAYADTSLIGIMYPDATEAAAVYAVIDGILTEISETLTCSITQYYDGNMQLLIALDAFTLDNAYVTMYANGEITVTTGAEIPSYAADVIAAIAEKTTALGDIEYTIYNTYSDGDYTYEIAYNEGVVVYEIYTGSEYTQTYTYDENGNLLSEVSSYVYEGEDGELYTYTTTYAYTYDEDDNILTESYSDSDGNVFNTTYTYDADGNVLTINTNSEGYNYNYETDAEYYFTYETSITYAYVDGVLASESYIYTYSNEEGASEYTNMYITYEEHGWESSYIYYNSDGEITSEVYYEYEITDTTEYDGYARYTVTITEKDADGNITDVTTGMSMYVWYD